MPTPQKVKAVQELKGKLQSMDAALLAEFSGLKVGEMMQVRRKLSESGAQFGVIKNSLGRIAAREADLEDLVALMEGSTAIAFVDGDVVNAARSLDEAAKDYPSLVVKGGVLDGKVLTAEQAQALAKIQSRDVLMAQLAGLLVSPIQNLAGLLNAPLGNLGNALYALSQQKQSEAPDAAGESE